MTTPKPKKLSKSQIQDNYEKTDFIPLDQSDKPLEGQLVHNLANFSKLARLSQKLMLNCMLIFTQDGMTLYMTNESTRLKYHIPAKKICKYFCKTSVCYSFDYDNCVNIFHNNTNYKNLTCIDVQLLPNESLQLSFNFDGLMTKNCVLEDKLQFSPTFIESDHLVTRSISHDDFRGIFMNSSKKAAVANFKTNEDALNIHIKTKNGNNQISLQLSESDSRDPLDITCEISVLNIINSFRLANVFNFILCEKEIGFEFSGNTFNCLIYWDPVTQVDPVADELAKLDLSATKVPKTRRSKHNPLNARVNAQLPYSIPVPCPDEE